MALKNHEDISACIAILEELNDIHTKSFQATVGWMDYFDSCIVEWENQMDAVKLVPYAKIYD